MICLTFATASVDELLTNWVLHVRLLSLPVLVAAMDFSVTQSCRRLGVHCLSHSLGADSALDLKLIQEVRAWGYHDVALSTLDASCCL